MTVTKDEEDAQVSQGMTKLVMVGSKFAGSKALFEEAVEAGECYQDEDGLYYTDSRVKKKTKKIELR
jgi:hypothetical protein